MVFIMYVLSIIRQWILTAGALKLDFTERWWNDVRWRDDIPEYFHCYWSFCVRQLSGCGRCNKPSKSNKI